MMRLGSGGGIGAAALLVLGGCAGATVGSGVGDTWLDRAPYWAGRTHAVATIAYQPVSFQAGATGPASFDLDGASGAPVATLLEALNAHLDALARTRGLTPVPAVAGEPPDVRFGCDQDHWGDCILPDDGEPEMRLAVGRPSRDWVGASALQLSEVGAGAVLVLTLETGNYWPRQTNWRGSKAVDLGTGRTVPLPWLTALDAPVSVIQLTGALVGADGRAIAIGAEGLLARRTSIVLAGFGVQAQVNEDDVQALMRERVSDRPGAPLVWQQALEDLIDGLVGSS